MPATARSSLIRCKHAAATHQAISIQPPVERLDLRTAGTQKAGLTRPLRAEWMVRESGATPRPGQTRHASRMVLTPDHPTHRAGIMP